jgi:hypothetical protein
MSGKPIDQGFLKRILGTAFKKAGGSVGPGGATAGPAAGNVPPKKTWKQEGWMFDQGDTVWKEGADPSMGMPQFPGPHDQWHDEGIVGGEDFDRYFGTSVDSTPDNMDQAGFFSRWGGMTAEGIPDFGQGTLADPMAPERRRREWQALKYGDDLVYGKRAKAFQKSLSARDKRDRIDAARSGFAKSALGDWYDPYRTARKSISDFELREAARNLNPADRANLYRLAGRGFVVGRAGAKSVYQQALEMEQALERGAAAGARLGIRGAKAGAKAGAKYGVIDPTRRAAGMVSAADKIAGQGVSNVLRSGQRLGMATRGGQYLGVQKGALRGTMPQSTGALNGVMRGLAGLFVLFIFISVFYMVFGPLYDVLITNFLSIVGADGSTMLGGKDIATLYANTANSILIWIPLLVIGGTLYLLISMVFERESKGMARTNEMLQWDALTGMDEDVNLDIAFDGGMDDTMGLYGPS